MTDHILSKHIHPKAIAKISTLLSNENLELIVSKPRKTKLGDFRPSHNHKPHRISVNSNLNQHAFLITLVHEIAHLKTWKEHRQNVAPHGDEWKSCYKGLMLPFLSPEIFPDNVLRALAAHLKKPKATSCSDPNLLRTLKHNNNTPVTLLEDLPENAIFKLGEKQFQKGTKLRTRFRCKLLNSKKTYLINMLAEVSLVNEYC